MSERVQLLLSDRILGMTLVPEGRVWNYGIGLTQMWSATLPYQVGLDTPLPFWAEQHRPANFLSVSSIAFWFAWHLLTGGSSFSSQVSRALMIARMSRIASLDFICPLYLSFSVLLSRRCNPLSFLFLVNSPCRCCQSCLTRRFRRHV